MTCAFAKIIATYLVTKNSTTASILMIPGIARYDCDRHGSLDSYVSQSFYPRYYVGLFGVVSALLQSRVQSASGISYDQYETYDM